MVCIINKVWRTLQKYKINYSCKVVLMAWKFTTQPGRLSAPYHTYQETKVKEKSEENFSLCKTEQVTF